MTTFRLTETEYEIAINALRTAAHDCEKSAKACEQREHKSTQTAFIRRRDQYLLLAEKIQDRPY